MAGKLLILCFVLAMITIATCKPRLNPFSGLFRRDYMMLENEKRAPGGGGCQTMSYCSTVANCWGSDEGGSYEQTPGDCGPNTVCCTYFVM